VANFGQAFPAIQVWSVPELRVAVHHFLGQGATTATDWQVLIYTLGRAMLWVVVLSACLSMYQYFRAFYQSAIARAALEREANAATRAKTTPPVGVEARTQTGR
jgi:hypothetical protein